MASVPLLPGAAALAIEGIRIAPDAVRFTLRPTAARQACPTCGRYSAQVHSHYIRLLRDLPAHGRCLELQIRVRRFRCTSSACPRQTFVEQIPVVMARHARKTRRLIDALRNIGLRVGGEAGARLATQLCMPVGADTLLRLTRRNEPAVGGGASESGPRVLGVDDWAFHRGQRYGTILCDLEAHRPVDLLPDRSAETLAAWLRGHRGVQLISRDRASDYAKGAAVGAPQARQIADRWHLLHNLVEGFQRALDRQHATWRPIARLAVQGIDHNATSTAEPLSEGSPAPVQAKPTRSQALQGDRRSRRQQRYKAVKELQAQGLSFRQIACQLGLNRWTVRRYAGTTAFPERAIRSPTPSPLDDYLDYLRQRWQEGCHNAARLHREIQQQGFTGSFYMVRRRVAAWRIVADSSAGTTLTQSRAAASLGRLSARSLVWLLLKPEKACTDQHKALLVALRTQWPELAENVTLIQEFRGVLRQRRVEDLEAWVELACLASIFPEIKRFAGNLRQDWDAVCEAIRQPWSNGQVEGQVNRLKLIKRQMYGRARFDLLRQRVLYAS